jgi:hypothetical protein
MTVEQYEFPKKVGPDCWVFEMSIRFDGLGHASIDINHDYDLDVTIIDCIARVADALKADEAKHPALVGMSDDYLLNVASDFADISRRLRAMADPAKATAYLAG